MTANRSFQFRQAILVPLCGWACVFVALVWPAQAAAADRPAPGAARPCLPHATPAAWRGGPAHDDAAGNLAKGRSSRFLRREFPKLRSRIPTLWTNSYFVSTVGGSPLSVVKQYIENQKRV